MALHFEADDLDMILREVAKFSQQRIAEATSRFENPLTVDDIQSLTHEAAELGLLSSDPQPDPSALWADTADASSMALSLGMLTHIGSASGSLAFAWHRASLALWVMRHAGLSAPATSLTDVTLLPTGWMGLARNSLGRWLNRREGEPLAAEDGRMLADWLDHNTHDSVLIAPRTWSQLLWPVWDGEGIQWQRLQRSDTHVQVMKPQHGLSDLTAFRVIAQDANAGQTSAMDTRTARQLYSALLVLDQIGLTAITIGVLRRGWAMARSFALLRKQGGKVIDQHPAVQAMLGEIAATLAHTTRHMATFHRPVQDIGLSEAMALRMSCSASLVAATHQVMQVHGGVGYMRDAGPELLVRDQNMLRLVGGGVASMDLLLHALTQESEQ